MNKTEKLAFNFLLRCGYKKKQIHFNANSSPDFITSDNIGWEVKPSKYFQFTEKQIQTMDYNTRILFVDEVTSIIKIKPFYEVLYNEYLEEHNGVCGFSTMKFKAVGSNLLPYIQVKPFAEPINKYQDDEKKEMIEWIGGWK